jgi:ribose 5-phosphate isomerase B
MTVREEDIKSLVRDVVMRTLGETSSRKTGSQPIVTAEMMQQVPVGSVYEITAVTLITPLAREIALERKIKFTHIDLLPSISSAEGQFSNIKTQHQGLIIAIGADHGGFALKEQLKNMLQKSEFSYTLVDYGTNSTDSVDYPDFAFAVARAVAAGKAWRGIIIDGAGIGSCMAANKVPGVRAAMCYDQATAVNSRAHNNANVLTLGAGLIGTSLANQIVTTWLTTDFGGGRHARRVDKIDQLDKRFQR